MATPLTQRSMFVSAGKLLSGQWTGMVLVFLEGIIVARSLGPEMLGVWAVIQSLFALTGSVLGFRTTEAVTRFLVTRSTETLSLLTRLLSTAVAVDAGVVLLTSIFAALMVWSAGSYAMDSSAISVYVVVLYAVASCARFPAAVWMSLMRSDRRFWRMSLVPLLGTTLRLAILVSQWSTIGITLQTLALAYFLSSWLIAAVQLWDVHRWSKRERIAFPARIGLEFGSTELRDFWTFMRAGFLTSSVSGIVKSADVLIVALWASNAQVGVYRIARSLAAAIQSAAAALSSSVFHDLTLEARCGRSGAALHQMEALSRRIFPIVAAAFSIAILVAWYAVPLAYGPAFSEARELLGILLMGIGVASILFWVSPLLLGIGNLRWYVGLTLGNALTGTLLMLLLSSLWGTTGCAAAVAGTWGVGHLVTWGALRYLISKPQDEKQ